MPRWNTALWLVGPIHVTYFNQSNCIISAKHNHTSTLKLFVYDMGSYSQSYNKNVQCKKALKIVKLVNLHLFLTKLLYLYN